MSTSLRVGLTALKDAQAALFVHADQPNITPELLTRLVARFRQGDAPIVAPAYRGQRGAPVLFARELFDELASVSGDEGGRSLIKKYADRAAIVEVDTPSIFADIDTMEDYYTMTNSCSLLGNTRGLISDMDGVLWRGNQPMPGLVDFFAFLRQAGIRFVLATNNASKTSADYVKRLAGFGVEVSPDEILCAAESTAEYLAQVAPGARLFVIGESPLENVLTQRGLTLVPEEAVPLGVAGSRPVVDFVVVGWNRELTWKKLARAVLLIRDGARFIGTNPDRTWPSEYGLLPGNGANLAFLQAATDVEPLVIGKPGQIMFEQALARLGLDSSTVVMLGDRIETDIEGGYRAGLQTIFVCSGVHTREAAEQHPARPLIFQDIAELVQMWAKERGLFV
jgi:4-nitrophenyl phosphatase